MNIKAFLTECFEDKRKTLLIAVPLVLVLLIAWITLSNSKNPLLDGQIRYQSVMDPTTAYCYKRIDVYSSAREVGKLSEKEYIEFLTMGVGAYSDDIGMYVIWMTDSTTAIIYKNGDSGTGYYVDYSQTLEPLSKLCIVKGIITRSGSKISYSPYEGETKLGDVWPQLKTKYMLPSNQYSAGTSPMQ